MFLDGAKLDFVFLYEENFLMMSILLLFLAYNSFTDIKNYKIHNKSNILLILTRVMLHFLGFSLSGYNLLSAVFFFFVILIPAMYFMIPMGGDIKLVTAVAFYLGFYTVPFLLGLSLLLSLAFSLIIELIKKDSRRKIPFAPFVLSSHIIFLLVSLMF